MIRKQLSKQATTQKNLEGKKNQTNKKENITSARENSKSENRSVTSNSLQSHGLNLPGSSVHGNLQARMLEWVAVPFWWGSSQPRNRGKVSRIAGRFFTIWATREPGTREQILYYSIYMSRKSKSTGTEIEEWNKRGGSTGRGTRDVSGVLVLLLSWLSGGYRVFLQKAIKLCP